MYHQKKIAVFVSHIYGSYQKNVCQGIIDQCTSYGYRAEIYVTNDGEDFGDYGSGEESIVSIPNFNDISGVIMASCTYPNAEMKDKIIDLLHMKCTCPIIEVHDDDPVYPAVALENNETAGQLTTHFIEKHAMNRVCYLGNLVVPFYSDKRKEAYLDALKENGRNASSADIFDCDDTPASYEEAVDFFASSSSLPVAVVCYNDHFALSFMITAMKKGYRIPEDFAISGCDDEENGHNTNPTLTTVSFPVHELGVTAVDQLLKLIRLEEIPDITYVHAEPVYRGSCGCINDDELHPIYYGQKLLHKIDRLESSILVSMRMSAGLFHITDIDSGMDLLEKYVTEIPGCNELYLCLYNDWDSEVDKEHVQMKLAIKDGKRLPECEFSKNSLLPEYLYTDSNSACIVSPLFFETQEFGYLVLSFADNQLDYSFQLIHWILNISEMLQKIKETEHTKLLSEQLADVYLKDVLTGLLNHHGYMDQAGERLKALSAHTLVTAILIDLDELKKINDHFGHLEGDFAIQVVGAGIKKATEPDMICSRFSGDEFHILLFDKTGDEVESMLSELDSYFEHYNRLCEKPYNICVSSGYAQSKRGEFDSIDDLNLLFNEADQQMYRNKNSKEKHTIR